MKPIPPPPPLRTTLSSVQVDMSGRDTPNPAVQFGSFMEKMSYYIGIIIEGKEWKDMNSLVDEVIGSSGW